MELKDKQRMSDIFELLTYIKSNIANSQQVDAGIELDGIATITKEIITTLNTLKGDIHESHTTLLDPYLAKLDESTSRLLGDLKTISSEIQENRITQEALCKNIADVQEKYLSDVDQVTKTLHLQIEHQDASYQDISKGLVALHAQIQDINDKILTETTLNQILQQLTIKIDNLAESDKLYEASSRSTLEVIGGQMLTTETLIKTMNDALDNISELFTQSNSRLEIVHVQADEILERLSKGDTYE